MAEIDSTAIGAGRKSIGNITYRYVNGRTIASKRVTKNNSKTPLQVSQRQGFTATAHLGKSLLPLIGRGFVKSAGMSARNNFVHFNKDFMGYAKSGGHYDAALPAITNLCVALGDPVFDGKVMTANGSIGLTSVYSWNGDMIEARLYASRDFREGDVVTLGVCYSYMLVGTFFESVRLFSHELTVDEVDKLVVKNQFRIDRKSFPGVDILAGLPDGFDMLELAVTVIVEGEKDRSTSYMSLVPGMPLVLAAASQTLDGTTKMQVTFHKPEVFAAEIGDKALGAKLMVPESVYRDDYQEYRVDTLSKDVDNQVNGVVLLPPGSGIFGINSLTGKTSRLVKGDEVLALCTGVAPCALLD